MEEGVDLLNFARDLLVDEDALIEAFDSGKVKKYVTDFANPLVAGSIRKSSLHHILEHPQRNPKKTVQ